MSLKHPKGPPSRTGDAAVAPLFSLETGAVSRHELPVGEMAPDLAYALDGTPFSPDAPRLAIVARK